MTIAAYHEWIQRVSELNNIPADNITSLEEKKIVEHHRRIHTYFSLHWYEKRKRLHKQSPN